MGAGASTAAAAPLGAVVAAAALEGAWEWVGGGVGCIGMGGFEVGLGGGGGGHSVSQQQQSCESAFVFGGGST